MKRYTIEATVFIIGASIMILELTASRILAPYVGTSLIVWTSILGVILAALSIGYWVGGKMADKSPQYETLSLIIFTAGAFILLISQVKELALLSVSRFVPLISLASILDTFLLFALPSVLLGMISPYAARLTLSTIKSSGETVGRLYALSTIGSIFGTFITGFYLLAILGNQNILVLQSFILFLTSFIVSHKKFLAPRILFTGISLCILLFSFFGDPSEDNIIDIDTRYNRVLIYNSTDIFTQKPIKILQLGNNIHSAFFLDSSATVLQYTSFFLLSQHYLPRIESALLIGGGAFTFSTAFLDSLPNSSMDVVEIDSELTTIAEKYFRLKKNPRLTIINEDGRMTLNNNEKKYDAIFADAYQGATVPYQLTTIEAIEKIYNSLSEDGVAFFNIGGSIDGQEGRYFRAQYATLKKVFPYVEVYPVNSMNPYQQQNIVVIATKKEPFTSHMSHAPQDFRKNLWDTPIKTDMPILTDDFAPVEQYRTRLTLKY